MEKALFGLPIGCLKHMGEKIGSFIVHYTYALNDVKRELTFSVRYFATAWEL